MSRAPGESASNLSSVTVGELKVWFSTEVSRIKADIDTLYDRVTYQSQQGALSSAKVHELDPIVQSLRDRVTFLESQMRSLDCDGCDENIVTTLAFSEYKRELDGRLRKVSDDVRDDVLNSLKPVAQKIEEDRKQLQELQTKVNGIIIKLALATSVLSFIAGKILESVVKAYITR